MRSVQNVVAYPSLTYVSMRGVNKILERWYWEKRYMKWWNTHWRVGVRVLDVNWLEKISMWLVLFQISRKIFFTSMQDIVIGLCGWIKNLECVRRLFPLAQLYQLLICWELHIATSKWDTILVLQLHSDCYFCSYNI